MSNRKVLSALFLSFSTLWLAGCASWIAKGQEHRSASAVDYLFPNAMQSPQMEPTTTILRPPIRVGVAFVPGGQWEAGISDASRIELLERVKIAFMKYPYVGSIEVIPSSYLRARGGFDNLDQLARMFNVEVVAVLSYDQVQFNDTNSLAVLYWTIVGAYVIHGDQYDVQTLLDASVFDVSSRKLLFRAPGTSRVKGSASMVSFSERARRAQGDGYSQAVDELIPQLQKSLDDFRERMKNDPTVKVENKSGYAGGGDLGWLGTLLLVAFSAVGYAKRRAP